MKHFSTKAMTNVAILSAIAFILMFIEIPLPFFPPFYKFDFSDLPSLIGGFAMGPISAISIEFLKIVIHLLFKPTSTAYVGEFANFLLGCFYVLPASILYRYHKTKKMAMLGLLIGSLAMVCGGTLLNYFVLLPTYSYFYHLPMDVIIGMGTSIFPIIKDKFTFVLFATFPFNVIKSFLVSIVTVFIYKRISPLLHKEH